MTLYAFTSLLRLRLRLQLVLLLAFYVLLIPDNKQQQCNIFLCSNSVQCMCMCVCVCLINTYCPHVLPLITCGVISSFGSVRSVQFGAGEKFILILLRNLF